MLTVLGRVDLSPLAAGVRALELAELVIPAEERVAAFLSLRELGIAPLGSYDVLDVVEKEVREGMPSLRPPQLASDGDDPVSVADGA